MKQKQITRSLFSALFLIITFAPSGMAGEIQFQTTKEDIIKELTKEPVRTRSFGRSITVVKKEKGKTVKDKVIENNSAPRVNLKIEFDYNSYAVRDQSFALIDDLGAALVSEKLRDRQILIKGHTDSDGADAYNLNLSLNRALSVRTYLLGNFAIEKTRIKAVGYGEAVPLAPNTSSENKQVNRRVEVQVMF